MSQKAVVFTLGCKVNEVESEEIATRLQQLGWEVSTQLQPADLYVLNTCAVTKEAEKKSRQLVARVRKFNALASVVVCGCASQKDSQSYVDRQVSFVFGTKGKVEAVVGYVQQHYPLPELRSEAKGLSSGHTRAFVKIEDGCNNFCSYCVIPYLRGRVTSRPADQIVKEVEAITSPEVVLTGINISAWSEGEHTLPDLIDQLSHVQTRIRLGSLECRIITDRLLTSLKALPDFAPQFHLSLQSGSNDTLRRMNRKYSREEYLQKCQLIYQYFPDAAITTDIIVGFCEETEQDFSDSLSIIDEAGLARVHAFAFSPREGTVAFTRPDVPAPIKNERLHRLLQKAEQARLAYVNKFVGKQLDCVLEEVEGDYTVGTSANYVKVYIQGKVPVGNKAKVVAVQPFQEGVLAKLI